MGFLFIAVRPTARMNTYTSDIENERNWTLIGFAYLYEITIRKEAAKQ
jgi:hypothetical protein